MYTNEDRVWLKEVIQKKIAETQISITELEDQSNLIETDDDIERTTPKDANKNKTTEVALPLMKESLLQLQNALNSIDDSEFGKCYVCEDFIPFAELVVAPESTRCKNCS